MDIDYSPDKWMYDSSDSDWDNMSEYWKELDEEDESASEETEDEFIEAQHPRDRLGRFAEKGFTDVIKRVESYRGKPEGTYDLSTGKEKQYSSGFCVSFHQNEPDENGRYKSHMGRYTEQEYDEITKGLSSEYGLEVNVGVFDNEPEVSFWTDDIKKAKELMVRYNQHSIYDVKNNKIIKNKNYDKTKNPMKGD